MNKQTSKTHIYMALYIFGAFLGLLLIFLSTWADLESSFYGFDRTGGSPFTTLRCPVIMTPTETSSFSVRVTNTADRRIAPSLIADISTPLVMNASTENLTLEPGESRRLSWAVGPENIDLKRFIFARAWLHAAYPLPDRESTCGIYILFLPGKGIYYTWGAVFLSIFGMGYGLYMMRREENPEKDNDVISRLTLLAAIVLIGFVFVYTGFWLGGILILVLAFLLVVISIGYSFKQ